MEPVATPSTQPADRDPVPPPPPPPPTDTGEPVLVELEPRHAPFRPPVAGQLTLGWRIATAIVWGLVFVAFVAVWKTSVELGLHTWWLGPVGERASPLASIVPFVAPVAMILLAINNVRGLPWFGLGAAGVTAVVAAFDIDNVPRLAIVEFAIAGAGALTAIGSLSGRYRTA